MSIEDVNLQIRKRNSDEVSGLQITGCQRPIAIFYGGFRDAIHID